MVPPERLDAEALAKLVEEFVTRDGTDYGLEERSLAHKTDAVMAQIKRGHVVVMFDLTTETANLMRREDIPPSDQS